jgi:hypothetical protein
MALPPEFLTARIAPMSGLGRAKGYRLQQSHSESMPHVGRAIDVNELPGRDAGTARDPADY